MVYSDVDKQFLSQIKNINSLFDLMALCIGFLHEKIKNKDIDLAEACQKCNDELQEEVALLLDIYMENRKYDMEKECLATLKRQLYEVMSGCAELCEASILMIIWMDDHEEPSYDDEDVYKYTALNKQFFNKIRIIPRLKENWLDEFSKNHKTGKYELLRDSSLTSYPDLQKLIRRYIIFDKDMIEEYNLNIVHLGSRNIFVKKLKKRQEIKRTLSFAVFPVLYTDFGGYLIMNKLENSISSLQHIRHFEILGMESLKEDYLKSRYKKIFERCKDKEIDFLIFPELMMTQGIFDEFRYQERLNSIKFWGTLLSGRNNQCNITGPTGKVIGSYNKKVGYEYEEKGTDKTFIEYIPIEKPADYLVIDVEGIVRIGICICRDLTFEKARAIYKFAEINILIVPSYSSSRDLYAYAEDLAKFNRCIVFVGNSCSAFYDPAEPEKLCKEAGFMAVPATKEKSGRIAYTMAYGNEECVSVCGEECNGKLFTLDFSKVMYENGIKTVKIDNSSL